MSDNRIDNADGTTTIKNPKRDRSFGSEVQYIRHYIDKDADIEAVLKVDGKIVGTISWRHKPTDGGMVELRQRTFPTGKPPVKKEE